MLARLLSGMLSFALLMVSACLARADAGDAARGEARERFDRGLARYSEGDLGGALAELERAHALLPNEVVLFNIGLVYAALKRPVEAVAALEQVLTAPGALSAERIAHARRVRDEQAARIAELTITSNVPATIEIDGVQAGQTPLAAPLRVASGAHHVALLASGYIPARREVVLPGGPAPPLAFELQPTDKLLAHVAIESPLPGAEVWVDGERVGRTPLHATLAVAPGTRSVELRRAGYVSAGRSLTLSEGASAKLRLPLEADPNAPLGVLGRLAVVASEQDASLTIDGRVLGLYRASVLLPAGPHRVRIERGGFEPAERDVELRAGETTELRATLVPTPETRNAHVESVQAQRRWGVIATVGGGALMLGGAVVGVWAESSLPELERELQSAERSFTSGSGTDCDTREDLTTMRPVCIARVEDAAARLDDRALLRTLGFVGLGTGVVAASIGIVLLVSNEDEHKYEHAETAPPIALTPWLGPDLTGASARIAF